jgi:thiamine-monophosphate kinase
LNIEAIAKNTELLKAAQLIGKSAREFVLNSGESYELLFTVRSDADIQLIATIAQKIGIGCTEIGKITGEQNGRWLVTSDGKREPLPKAGWDHFAGHL